MSSWFYSYLLGGLDPKSSENSTSTELLKPVESAPDPESEIFDIWQQPLGSKSSTTSQTSESKHLSVPGRPLDDYYNVFYKLSMCESRYVSRFVGTMAMHWPYKEERYVMSIAPFALIFLSGTGSRFLFCFICFR